MRVLCALLASLALLLPFTAPVSAQDCNDSIVSNGHFTDGWIPGNSIPPGAVTDWSTLTGTPQVVVDGCQADSGSVQMWGNLVVGESIQQNLPGAGIQAGKTYSVTVCYRWLDNGNLVLPQYVRFRLTASAGSPTGYPATSTNDVIGATPNTSSTSWISYTFPDWTAPNNASWITINPENDSTVNDGDFVSWGLIDDVCIVRVSAVPTERTSWGSLKARYPSSN